MGIVLCKCGGAVIQANGKVQELTAKDQLRCASCGAGHDKPTALAAAKEGMVVVMLKCCGGWMRGESVNGRMAAVCLSGCGGTKRLGES